MYEKFRCRTLASRLFAYYRRGKGMQVLTPICLDEGKKKWKEKCNDTIELKFGYRTFASRLFAYQRRGKTCVKILKGTMYLR